MSDGFKYFLTGFICGAIFFKLLQQTEDDNPFAEDLARIGGDFQKAIAKTVPSSILIHDAS